MQRKQILWRCRRGMKELDALLVSYVESLSEVDFSLEHGLFEALLDSSDEQLWRALVLGHPHEEARFASLIQRILRASNNPLKID
jgi:antitoxin CptB